MISIMGREARSEKREARSKKREGRFGRTFLYFSALSAYSAVVVSGPAAFSCGVLLCRLWRRRKKLMGRSTRPPGLVCIGEGPQTTGLLFGDYNCVTPSGLCGHFNFVGL